MNKNIITADFLEKLKCEEFTKEQFIKGAIYDNTQDYGRTQFVDEIYKLTMQNMELEKRIRESEQEIDRLHTIRCEYGNYVECTHILDDYKKAQLVKNKYLVELNDGSFVDINEVIKFSVIENSCEQLQQENRRLKDELEWYKQQCDDLEMELGDIYE